LLGVTSSLVAFAADTEARNVVDEPARRREGKVESEPAPQGEAEEGEAAALSPVRPPSFAVLAGPRREKSRRRTLFPLQSFALGGRPRPA